MMPVPGLWDVFCRVIDNHGDLGVSWRLCQQLVQHQQRVRLWLDDARALAWMAPHHATQSPHLSVHAWADMAKRHVLENLPAADVWVEMFGCELDGAWLAHHFAQTSTQPKAWINLEYLSAEPYVQRCHQLASPIMQGAARGATRHFFYPGFTQQTGGLLREPNLLAHQTVFNRANWLASQGIAWQGQRIVTLFCYEPAALQPWLHTWAKANEPTLLLVTAGRAQAAVHQALSSPSAHQLQLGALHVHELNHLSQIDFDHLLWSGDLNLVRGEDSWVRAIWAGKPFVWHIYPQDDGAHWTKLNAFLNSTQAPDAWQQIHADWNACHPPATPLDPFDFIDAGQRWTSHLRENLIQHDDLCTQLLKFAQTRLK